MPDELITIEIEPELDDWLRSWGVQTQGVMLFIEGVVDELAGKAKLLYEATVKTWSRKPLFRIDKRVTSDTVTEIVGTNDEQYGWVDRGTKTRSIVPRSAGGVLVFRSEYTPRTRPGILSSGQKSSGGDLIFTKIVRRHRIKARRFTPMIKRRVESTVAPVVSRRLTRWIEALEG